jgi:hypothetical protein
MKIKIAFFLTLIGSFCGVKALPANTNFGVGAYNCTVGNHDDGGDRSLRDLILKANTGTGCRYNIDFLTPTRIVLQSPVSITASGLFITGADVTSDDLPPLEIVLDGREVGDRCLFIIKDSSQSVMADLTIYVLKDKDKAICDEEGRSVSESTIRICRGDEADDCNWSPASQPPPESHDNNIESPDPSPSENSPTPPPGSGNHFPPKEKTESPASNGVMGCTLIPEGEKL